MEEPLRNSFWKSLAGCKGMDLIREKMFLFHQWNILWLERRWGESRTNDLCLSTYCWFGAIHFISCTLASWTRSGIKTPYMEEREPSADRKVPSTEYVFSECRLLGAILCLKHNLETEKSTLWDCPWLLWGLGEKTVRLASRRVLVRPCVKMVPETRSCDCKSGAPCGAASPGRYFNNEWSQRQGVCKRHRGLGWVLSVDHTHATGLFWSTAYGEERKLSIALPSGPEALSKPLSIFIIILFSPWALQNAHRLYTN